MKILYISPLGDTDLSELLSRCGAECDVLPPSALPKAKLSEYDGFVFDGTGTKAGLLFTPAERIAADLAAESGKPALCVFCPYIMTVCCSSPVSTRFERPAVTAAFAADGLEAGDLLDEQCNSRVPCYMKTSVSEPLLRYVRNPRGFYRTEPPKDGDAALWFERENVLLCTFALSDFARACFAPKNKWRSLISYICRSLFGVAVPDAAFDKLYAERGYTVGDGSGDLDALLSESVRRAVEWHFASGAVEYRDNAPYAMTEGLSAEIYPDGSRAANRNIVIDGNGETAMMLTLDAKYGGGDHAAYISAFREYALSHVRDYGGILDGYGSSGDGAWWNACYGDDVARSIILPQLFAAFSGDDAPGLDKALSCLDFLVNTTGSDGLRFCRTDIVDREKQTLSLFSLDKADGKWSWGDGGIRRASELKDVEAKTPSAHYNGYYLACLLLAFKVTGRDIYRDTAVRGLTSVMEKYYPETAREHSETEELCRLVLPLSYLYWVTKERKHLGWLEKVIRSLDEKRRPDGAIIEWDTGYIACCAGKAGGECSVLCENGNPVVDLLYSLNWLPFSLSQAYFITGSAKAKEMFESVSRFLASIQISSPDKTVDGAWARAFDCDAREVYGVPNDVGWAPWSVEAGWTMAQIPSGFLLWLMRDKYIGLYR